MLCNRSFYILIDRQLAYYKPDLDKNKCTVIVAKNREGRTGELDIWVDNCITNFKDEVPTANYVHEGIHRDFHQ